MSLNYNAVRKQTEHICTPLIEEDYVVQPIIDVSPPKWHIGHTTWFFETFVLKEFKENYTLFNEQYNYIFNSYYESKGERILRSNRGNLSRPSVQEIYQYRSYVDKHINDLLQSQPGNEVLKLIELGLNHEQQHQELLLTDIKYILGTNPLHPVYNKSNSAQNEETNHQWLSIDKGIYKVGYEGDEFHWDNEREPHEVLLNSYQIRSTLVSNKEYLEFINDGGYSNFQYWSSEGFQWINDNGISAPLYWYKKENTWLEFTLSGISEIDPNAPVTHISFFEADAFAAWKGCRLPTEFEWEVACSKHETTPNTSHNFVESEHLHPISNSKNNFLGNCWEWTNSSYLPYPGYKKADGALGEYNGKFMINQMVLRGGSCATPLSHIRPTYRNFFPTSAQWQFTGIRLAQDI